MAFFDELKRRNVLRIAAAYVVVAWLVIQVVETILPAFGFGDVAVRFVTVAFAAGFLPALIFAWVFELTPEGLKLDREVERDPVSDRKASKRLDRVILVVLALALGYFVFDRFVLIPEQTARDVETARQEGRTEALIESYGEDSIAVLAFEDMSVEGDQAYLGDGIAEEVLNLLAKIPQLRVISRSSAFVYKDKDVPLPEIARQLNVDHILEGSVRKSGDRIRITAQLIDARSDTHLWSETYDRQLGDIFAIQDELAAALVDQLKLELLGQSPHTQPINSQAYDLYLQALYLKDTDGRSEAAKLLEQVVASEPEFADAWAELTEAYLFTSPSMGSPNHDGDPVWAKAMESLERLRSIDPDHRFILTSEGWAAAEQLGDFSAAARKFERAINRYPQDLQAIEHVARFAAMIKRYEISIVYSQLLVSRDPLCSRCAYGHAHRLMRAGRFKDAESAIMRYRDVLPGKGGELRLGNIRLVSGDIDGAEEAYQSREDEAGRQYGQLLVRAARGGDETLLGDIEAFGQLDNYLNPWATAELYALAGQAEAALDWLERGAENLTNWRLAYQLDSPLLDSLHSEPRWHALEARAGVAPEQLAEITFNPRMPHGTSFSP